MKQVAKFSISTFILALAPLFIVVSCQAQSIKVQPPAFKKMPSSYLSVPAARSLQSEAQVDMSGAYDLTGSLPAGYVKDGTVDYTTYLQKGITNNKDVVFPDFPVMVNTKGLVLKSNTSVYFKDNSLLIMSPNGQDSYAVLRLQSVSNVKLYNPKIQGDRKAHTGTTGQWGMGISIKGSNGIRIYNPVVNECWGDGIYIGSSKGVDNKDIEVYNARLDYNRRNGISVTNVDGLKLINPVISNTLGQAPMAGIDIEPNSNDDDIDNILIDRPVTYNNGRFGIVISLGQLLGAQQKNVNIVVNDHVDDGSVLGLGTSLGTPKQRNAVPLRGKIDINNPTWKYSGQQSYMNFKTFSNGLNVNYKNISIIKKDRSGKDYNDKNELMQMQSNFKGDRQVMIQ